MTWSPVLNHDAEHERQRMQDITNPALLFMTEKPIYFFKKNTFQHSKFFYTFRILIGMQHICFIPHKTEKAISCAVLLTLKMSYPLKCSPSSNHIKTWDYLCNNFPFYGGQMFLPVRHAFDLPQTNLSDTITWKYSLVILTESAVQR